MQYTDAKLLATRYLQFAGECNGTRKKTQTNPEDIIMSQYDALAEINQTLLDKIASSVTYPFSLFERRKSYDGFLQSDGSDYKYTSNETENMVAELTADSNRDFKNIDEITVNFSSELSEIEGNIKNCLSAYDEVERHNKENPSQKLDWQGPSEKELNDALASVQSLASNSDRSIRQASQVTTLGLKFEAILAWIRVRASRQPKFTLSSKEFELTDLRLDLAGTGEVWVNYNWLKCVKKKWGICYQWKWTARRTRLLSVTLSGIKFRIKASAVPKVFKNTLVNLYVIVKTFRLDHKYLDMIPLENLANDSLGNKPVPTFDVAEFKKTLPLLKSTASINSVTLPSRNGSIAVAMEFTIS